MTTIRSPRAKRSSASCSGANGASSAQLEDGDEIDLGGDVRLHVLHTPGHTPGSASFYWESQSLLFSGDAVGGRGSRAGGFPLYFSAADYASSLRRLLDLDVGDAGPGASLPLVGADPGGRPHRARGAANTRRVARQCGRRSKTRSAPSSPRSPASSFSPLVEHVIRATAADLDNDPEARPRPQAPSTPSPPTGAKPEKRSLGQLSTHRTVFGVDGLRAIPGLTRPDAACGCPSEASTHVALFVVLAPGMHCTSFLAVVGLRAVSPGLLALDLACGSP